MNRNFVENEILSTINYFVDKEDARLRIEGEGTEISITDVMLENKSIYFVSALTKVFKNVIWKYGSYIETVQLTVFTYERKYKLFPWPKKRHCHTKTIPVRNIWVCDMRVFLMPKILADIGEEAIERKTIRLDDGYLVVNADQITGLKINLDRTGGYMKAEQIKQTLDVTM